MAHITPPPTPATVGSVAVKDEGSTAVATATALNFVGTGVTATDAGSGVALVTIPGVDYTTTFLLMGAQ